MFEKAARMKLRFDSAKGPLSVEHLWELPLTSVQGVSLDGIAVDLHRQMKNDNISFVNPEQQTNARLQLKFDVVRHIIEVRLAEKKAADEAHNRSERKQKLLGIIARKEDAALEGQPLEELRKLLNDL